MKGQCLKKVNIYFKDTFLDKPTALSERCKTGLVIIASLNLMDIKKYLARNVNVKFFMWDNQIL